MLTPINQKLFELLEYDLKDKRFTKDLSIIDKEQRSKTTNIDIDINGLNESLSIAINKKFETLTEEKKLYGYLSEEKKLQSIINKINEKPFVELEQERKTFEEKLEKVTGHQEKIKQEKGTVVYTSDQTFNTETYQNEKLILSRINVAENNRLIGNINDSILAAETRVNILREESRKLKNHLSQNLEVIEQKIKELKPMLPPTPKEEERRKSWEMNNNVVIVQLEKLEKEKTVIESQIKTIDVATSRTVPIAQVEFSKDLPKKEDIPKEQPSQIVKESVPLHRADSEKVQPSIPVPPPMPRDPLWQRQETQKSEKAPHPIEPNVIIQEQPSQKRENGPRPRAASDPGESRTDVPDSGKKTQDTPERDKKEEPDKSTKDALHTAIGENLKARQELLQVTIEKQREILGIIPKKAKHLPELNAIDKKIQENEAELAKLKTQLDDPKTWKPEMIQLPKGQSATVENIKADTDKIKTDIEKIKSMDIKDLKKELFPHSKKMRWLRRALHLWPLAAYPLFVSWAVMILPALTVSLYAAPVAITAFSFFCASYYVPKLINYARKKIANRREAQKDKEELNKGLTKEKEQPEVTKEVTKEAVKETEKEAKKTDITTNEKGKETLKGEKTAEPSLEPSTKKDWKTKTKDFLKNNWKSLAIIVGGSTLIAVASVFLMPIIAPGLVGAGIFTLGTVALMGASVGIGAQLIDKFGLKKVENHLNKREEKNFDQKLEKALRTFDLSNQKEEKVKEVQEVTKDSKIKEAKEQGISSDISRTSPVVSQDALGAKRSSISSQSSLGSIDSNLFAYSKDNQQVKEPNKVIPINQKLTENNRNASSQVSPVTGSRQFQDLKQDAVVRAGNQNGKDDSNRNSPARTRSNSQPTPKKEQIVH
ncbi:hypothetical protein P742_0101330 [Enterococcus faecium UC8668]|uniref:hypothetical protein n=1 Tax=Enterococcus faecium TaxID=1352 RepID=UPI0003F82765|nr:hypothetical protein [Enterococcus faecium]KEI53880.1 hypothetical protein P742_0101330 [Enterococcus faecium UC8668]